MIYPMVLFSLTLSDPEHRFQGHGVTIDAVDVLCAQLTRNLCAIAKYFFCTGTDSAQERDRQTDGQTVVV